MKPYMIAALALILIAATNPRAARAMSTTVNCPNDSIGGALNAGFDEITVNGTCNEDVDIRQDDVTIQGGGSGGTVVGQFFVNGARRVTIQNLNISGSSSHGIAAVDGATVAVTNVTIDGVADFGIIATDGTVLHADQVTIRNSGGGSGIVVEMGAQASVANSTILDNGDSGISLNRGSVASLSGNTIRDSVEGVSLDVSSTVWLDGNTISTNQSADSSALILIRGSTARLNGGNTLASSGFALVATNGSTLIQHQVGHDKVDGPIQISVSSNAEFRSVEIAGPIEVSDHSLLRVRDTSGNPTNVSVRGSISISQDSGLNFLKSVSDQRVKVVGNITCADTESSISAPSSNVTINGKTKGCTGYNYVSN